MRSRRRRNSHADLMRSQGKRASAAIALRLGGWSAAAVGIRRHHRSGGSGGVWHGMVRQRYRYDASNQRLIKQTLDASPGLGEPSERVHLYVYPGRFERSGVITDGEGTGLTGFVGSVVLGSETQYMVGGARAVWKTADSVGPHFAPERRLTYVVKDVIQSTSAVVDLISGELLELTTFYPNGARETHRTQDGASVQLELSGFTGKEADEEVGVVYFGERYLIPRIGRWASPDPLAIHAAGGGEVLNAYHYVSGNLLQARDPIGLESEDRTSDSGGTAAPIEVNTAPEGIRYGQEFVLIPGEVPEGAERIAKHTYLAPQSTLESLKERGANSYVYNPDAKLSLETARRVEAEHGPSGLRDLANLMATMQGLVTNTPESLPGVRGIRGGETPHGSDTDGAYLAVIAAQVATAVGPPSIAKLARVAAKAAKAVAAAARRGAGAVLEGTPQSVGAMRRLIFDTEVSAQRHVPGVARTGASPGPINGQDALDSSVPIGSNTSRRVGID